MPSRRRIDRTDDRIRGIGRWQPSHIGKSPEPLHLPSGQLAGRDFDLLDCFIQRGATGEVIDQFGVTGRSGGGRPFLLPRRQESLSRSDVF